MGNVVESEPAVKASVPSRTTRVKVEGMTCSNCARHVTEAIQGVPGVDSAVVNLEGHQASVRWKGNDSPDAAAVIRAVEEAGYEASEIAEGTEDEAQGRAARWQLTLWVGVLGTLPLMLGEWVFGLAMVPWFQWASFALATLVQTIAGAPFYRGAWKQLKAGSSNMDTLVALGSTTAYGYSTWALLTHAGGHVYFMEAASIITLISVGHWMESRVAARASGALRQLLNLAPSTARKLLPNGQESEVPISSLQPGDKVALRPGDRVPTDGEVAEGVTAIDESMLTGESVPVDKSAGHKVYTGTHNLNGRVILNVTATGEETALSHIIAAVQRAQTSRANIQRLGDRISNVFVPVVVFVALCAGLWWGLAPDSARATHAWLSQFLWHAHVPPSVAAAAFITVAAVLIIACPCAMGLATPAAIMAGSNAAAERGILIRDGVSLEKAGNISTVLFDKTGTLTVGKPEIAAVWVPESGEEQSFKGLAAALARNSSHPLSQAIASHSGVRPSSGTASQASNISPGLPAVPGPAILSWEEKPGAGILARLASQPGQMTRLGSLRWLRETGVDANPADSFAQNWAGKGANITGLSSGSRLLGLFAIRDSLKPAAREVISKLKKSGYAVCLVTGDNPVTAAAIANEAGIPKENVYSEVRPEEKAGLVQKLQQEGHRVAFVGDGINDAPALQQANLGVAVSRASDIAREAADIILLRSDVEAVPESLGLARATLRTIKQNLFWAFFYNALGIPLAALGFMSPVLCAAAMGVSDVIVIGNALRLRRFRLR